MTTHLRLKNVVGQIYSVNPDDVVNVKTALQRLERFDNPELGITSIPNGPMFDGIKKLQKERSLVADGVMAPGGPT